MTTQKSPSRGIFLAVLILAIAVLGGGWYVQQEVEKQVRAQIEEQGKKIGAVTTVGGVSYSLLNNTLEVTNIKVDRIDKPGVPATVYTTDRVAARNINRSLVLAAVMGNLSDQKGTLPVIDTLEVGSYQVITKQYPLPDSDLMDMDITVPAQTITNITVNMDVLGPLLAKTDVSETAFLIGLFQSCAYASRTVPAGTKGTINSKQLKGEFTMGAGEERNVGAGGIEYASARDMVLKFVQQDNEVLNFSMSEMIMERMFFSPELLKLLMDAQTNPASYDEKAVLKTAFLGDRPVIGAYSIKDVKVKVEDEQFDFASFVYENSSTKPFALSISLTGLRLPTSILPEDTNMATELLGMKDFTSNFKFTGLFPLQDPAGLTKMEFTSSIDKIGMVSFNTEGTLPPDLTLADFESANVTSKDFMTKMIKVSYTDTGLVPMGAKLMEKMMGLNPSQALALVETTQKAEVAGGKISQANLDAIMAFLRQPGTISLTLAPNPPVPLRKLLNELDLAAEDSMLEVTKGEKTLEEQIKAIN